MPDLDTSWSIGEESFSTIVSTLSSLVPANIVEFGSGTSSVRLALSFPKSKIISVENDPHYYELLLEQREKHKLDNLEIHYCPLKWQVFKLCFYYSYSLKNLPEKIDAVIIDGPSYTAFRGREYCLYLTENRLKTNGVVILDDYRREMEKDYVRNWLATYPEKFELKIIKIDHELCLLTKRGNGKAVFNFAKHADNYYGIIRLIIMKIKNILRHGKFAG